MKTINVLTIDGGGIRGLMSAKILKHIEERIQEETKSDIKLAEYFDLIVGTSTGGVLSSIYCFPDENGKPKFNASDAVDLYLEYGGFIFSNGFKYKLKSLFGLTKSRYDGENLRESVKKYLGSDTKISKSVTNLMITSVDPLSNELFLFKSHKAKKDKSRDYTFYDAAIATSAAPIYLPPHKIGNQPLVDGGMSINNPSMSAYVEASKMFKNSKINVLSIGTGTKINKFDYEDIKGWGIYGWLFSIHESKGSPLVDLILNASSKGTEYITDQLYHKEFKGDYLRLDPMITDEMKFGMDDASNENLKEMVISSNNSINKHKKDIDDFIKKSMK